MKPLYRGLLAGALQCLVVLTLAGKYALDRATLPRVWVKCLSNDPATPIRGRYVILSMEAEPFGAVAGNSRLVVQDGKLTAIPSSPLNAEPAPAFAPGASVVVAQVPFFIPEHVPDPSRRRPGEELWVEVTVTPQGRLRPIRLGVRANGVLKPLDLN